MTSSRTFWRPALKTIFEQLEAGDYMAASRLLFDPKVQQDNRSSLEFWHAQILVAAIQNMGFHIAFLTGRISYGNRRSFQDDLNMNAMIAFFEKYADLPHYQAHRDTILQLAAFYRKWHENNSRRSSPTHHHTPIPRLTSDSF